MVRGNILKLILAGILCVTWAQESAAQQFRLTVASPIAGNTPGFKSSLFVVRTDGCPDSGEARITATAEGIVAGVRRSVALTPAPLSQAGAYAIARSWPAGGAWVVNLTASCRALKAGAIIPIGSEGFLREPSKFLSRPATTTEIDAALNTLASEAGI